MKAALRLVAFSLLLWAGGAVAQQEEALLLIAHPAFRDLPARPLPNSEQLANEVLSLPIHPDLDDDEVDRVIEAVLAAV